MRASWLGAAGCEWRARHVTARDQLVLLTLAVTGLRRSELIALDWGDVTLDGPRPSLLRALRKGWQAAPPAAPDTALRKTRTPTRRALRITFGPRLLRPSRRSASAGDPRRTSSAGRHRAPGLRST
jgi:integrase